MVFSVLRLASPVLLALGIFGCVQEDSAAGPGTFTLPLFHDGVDREAIVVVPESYDSGTPAPVVLNFHGFGGTAQWHMEEADLRRQAEADGFILIYPQGSLTDEGESHWNTLPPGGDNKSDADDFGFVEAILAEVGLPFSVDRERVYAVGYSNGGMLAFGLACHRPDLVAAIGAVSGAMLDDVGSACIPPPTAVITLHGTEDYVLGYDGGEGFASAQGVVDFWVDVNGITAAPEIEVGDQVESTRYPAGPDGFEVHHHKVVGGGHVWFGAETLDTNQLLWDFVSRFSAAGSL